jgi:putative endonuclease
MRPPRPDTQAIGRAAEDAALRFYENAGFRLVTRNYRTRRGEIDLVLTKGSLLLFVEVKGRAGDWEPHAWLPQWRAKKRRLGHATRAFLARNPAWADAAEAFASEIVFVTQGRVSARFRDS